MGNAAMGQKGHFWSTHGITERLPRQLTSKGYRLFRSISFLDFAPREQGCKWRAPGQPPVVLAPDSLYFPGTVLMGSGHRSRGQEAIWSGRGCVG